MSVQIQFHIIDKFIKLSPDVTTGLPLLTKALDILHTHLLRIYEGFSKRNGPFIPIYIFTRKLQQLQIMKSTQCTRWGMYSDWYTTVQPKFLVTFRVFRTRELLCIII